MFSFIEGQVCEKGNGILVLLASGIGWQLSCSMSTLQSAPMTGETMRCYTIMQVREDAVDLFGFASQEERDMFKLLTGISGIGGKMALGLLGAMSLHDLNMAIILDDTAALSRAPGIGKKMAQRICVELKDKVSQSSVSTVEPVSSGNAFVPAAADAVTEAIEALIALGYSSQEARSAVSKVKDQSDRSDELIRLALRAMMGM